MQPTVNAELAAVGRALESLAGEHELPAEVTAQLTATAQAVKRIERSWSRVLPYLAADNAALEALLRALAADVPDELRASIDAVLAEPAPPPLELDAVNARNEALRAVVARAAAVPAAQARVHAQLQRSLDQRPW